MTAAHVFGPVAVGVLLWTAAILHVARGAR